MLARTASTENGIGAIIEQDHPACTHSIGSAQHRAEYRRMHASPVPPAAAGSGLPVERRQPSIPFGEEASPATACGLPLPVIFANVLRGTLDHIAAAPPTARFQCGEQGMGLAPFGHQKEFGNSPAFARIGEQPQALGQNSAFALAALFAGARHRP